MNSTGIAGSLILAAALAAAAPAQAENEVYVPIEQRDIAGYVMVQGVNARTGNFAITYPAFEQRGIPYRRTYNSNADNHGTFGFGWGSSLDTRAVALADGRVAVIENGNGAITVYGALPKNDMTPQTLVNGTVTVPLSEERWETREEMEQAVADGLANPDAAPQHSIGDKLYIESPYAMEAATACGDGAVLAIALSGYIRMTCAGRVEFFDENGHLIRYMTDPNTEQTVEIERNADGVIERVYDSSGRRLRFIRLSPTTLKVIDEDGEDLTYEFDGDGRNIRISGYEAPTYSFEYAANGRLGSIGYIDSTAIRIAYDDQGRATKLTTREGNVFEFRYDPGKQQTLIIQRPYNGEPSGMLAHFTD